MMELDNETLDTGGEAPVLVVVVNSQEDLARARDQGWYRIPVGRAPPRIAAEFLAFYLTGAFPEQDRWAVKWVAPVSGYRVMTRLELLPHEADHPRAGERYYRVSLGPLRALKCPIPSRRLRRITFISTTLARLAEAEEINDLWLKSTAQERLWAALKQADADAERQYPLREDLPQHPADFALFGDGARVAVFVSDEPASPEGLRESQAVDYLLASELWTAVWVTCAELAADPQGWAAKLVELAGSPDLHQRNG